MQFVMEEICVNMHLCWFHAWHTFRMPVFQ
uniref:Uncharacterized protein n=1 Tax=Rhizophora mucronata TaxID=61149 RepID=A0A2P2QZP9_RHIMU